MRRGDASAARRDTSREPIRGGRGSGRGEIRGLVVFRFALALAFRVALALLLALDALVDFFAVDGNILRRVDADPYLVALHTQDGHGDIVTDHHSLTDPSRQYEHSSSSLVLRRPGLESRKATYESTDSTEID